MIGDKTQTKIDDLITVLDLNDERSEVIRGLFEIVWIDGKIFGMEYGKEMLLKALEANNEIQG